MLAAHDAANVMRRDIVGDDGHGIGQRIGLAVEGQNLLAGLRLARDQRTAELGAIIDMERAAKTDHDEIGDVDQSRDRLLTDRFQATLEPFRRRAIGDAGHALRIEGRAGIGCVRAHIRASALRRDGGQLADDRIERLERANALGRQIARNAAHAHAILPVGRHRDFDDGIVQPGIIGKGRADRRILGQFDDAVMILAQLQLARGAHHAVGFDTADRRDTQHHAIGRHRRAGKAEHADQARTRIGRTADDLQRAIPSIDGQNLQLVGLRMRRSRQHARNFEAAQLLCRIFDAFDLKADVGERHEQFIERGGRLKMILEPGQSELHAPTPPDKVGASSAEKP